MDHTTITSGQRRNLIFTIFLLIVLISLIITGTTAKRDNVVLLNDSLKYQQAQQLMQKSNYTQASGILTDLLKRHDYYYQLLWSYGICMTAQGKWAPADQYMDQARQIRPALVADQVFLVQYGEVLYHRGDYTRARRYLNESLKYNKQPQATAAANKLLQQMNATSAVQKPEGR